MSQISGAQAIVKCLLEENVDTIFGYPGGAVIDLYDELSNCPDLTHVLVRHEQAAVHAAELRLRFTDQGYQAAAHVLVTVLSPDGRAAERRLAGPNHSATGGRDEQAGPTSRDRRSGFDWRRADPRWRPGF